MNAGSRHVPDVNEHVLLTGDTRKNWAAACCDFLAISRSPARQSWIRGEDILLTVKYGNSDWITNFGGMLFVLKEEQISIFKQLITGNGKCEGGGIDILLI